MFRKLKLSLLGLLIVGSGSAYAKEKPPIYNPEYSHALNMWIAGEMGNEIKDQKIPKEQAESFLNTSTGRAIDAGVNIHNMKFAGTGTGLANTLGAVNFILGSVLDKDRPVVRNSVWYWLEDKGQTKEEAQLEFAKLLISAVEKTMQELGYRTSNQILPLAKGKYQYAGVNIYDLNDGNVCTNVFDVNAGSNCFVFIDAVQPKKVKYNFKGVEGKYWFFSSGDLVNYSTIKFVIKEKNNLSKDISETFLFNQVSVQANINKEMGDGFFTYLAPEKSMIDISSKLSFPILFENGEPFYFVKVK